MIRGYKVRIRPSATGRGWYACLVSDMVRPHPSGVRQYPASLRGERGATPQEAYYRLQRRYL